jgi:DNA-binding transcriptional LysR family regulator
MRAREMAPAIREGLILLRTALSPSLFDPASAERCFTISAGSYFCGLLIPRLLGRALEVAPRVSFTVTAPNPNLAVSLDEGSIDLALGAFGRVPRRLVRARLYREQLVWIASADNTFVNDPPCLADIARNPRLRISTGWPYAGASSYISERGLESRVTASSSIGMHGVTGVENDGASIYDLSTAIAIVGRTRLVALVPRRFAQRYAEASGLVLIEAAGAPEVLDISMLWHSKLAADPGLIWLRALIEECLAADPVD